MNAPIESPVFGAVGAAVIRRRCWRADGHRRSHHSSRQRARPLQGIDAPETHQACTAYGQKWPCGRNAADWLKEYLHGRQVDCVGHARDRYGRLLAVCYAADESLNERIVREGWALDFRKYSTDYLQAESEAKRAGAGIWRGEFVLPSEWRTARQ